MVDLRTYGRCCSKEEDRNEGCLQLRPFGWVWSVLVDPGDETRSRPTFNGNPASPKAEALRPSKSELFHLLAMHRHCKAAEERLFIMKRPTYARMGNMLQDASTFMLTPPTEVATS